MSTRIIICVSCGQTEFHKAKRLCKRCYDRRNKRDQRKRNPEYFRELDKRRWPKRRGKENARRKARYYANYEEEIEKRRIYREQNRKNIYKQQAEYRDRNREKVRARNRHYNHTKRDQKKEMARLRAWAKKQPIEKLRAIWRASSQRRLAQKRNLPSTLTKDEWKEILHSFNFSCSYCGKIDVVLHQEHKIPLSRGGGYVKENIIPACISCNSKKGTKTYEEYMTHVNNSA